MMSQDQQAEQVACEKAQDIARRYADVFWKGGQTTRALEMYGASNTSAVELLQMHDNLLRASEIRRALDNELNTLKGEMPNQTGHSAVLGWSKCPCAKCEAHTLAPQKYKTQIRDVLGWNENAPVQNFGNIMAFYEAEFMGAARRCLVLISRMSPSQNIVRTE